MPKTKDPTPKIDDWPAWRRTETPAPKPSAGAPRRKRQKLSPEEERLGGPMTREAREAWARELDALRTQVKTGPQHRTAEDLVRAVRDEESGAEG